MERKTTEERKIEIVQVALDLLMEEGMQSLTIKNISKKNNISEAAIYRHFADKHAILMALADNFEENLMKAIDGSVTNYKNPIQKLKQIMKAHILFTEKHKGVLFSITAESIHCNDDELRCRILEVIEKYKTRIKKILSEAKQEGLIHKDINLDGASLTFFGLIQLAIIQYALTNYTVPPMTKFNNLWNIFLKGIKCEH